MPDELGVLAIGLSIVTFGNFVADAGLGASFVAQAQPPMRRQLQALAALQLSLTTAVAIVAGAVAIVAFPDVGVPVAVMAASLPVYVVRAPSIIMLERRLAYGTIAWIEVFETLAYAAWVGGCVVADAGLVPIAAGSVARALAGTVIALASVQSGRVRPRSSPGALSGVLRFGAMFQAGAAIYLGRAYVLNAGIIAIGGISVVGYSSIADRLIQIPFLVIGALSRVAFPALSRVVELADASELVRRGNLVLSPLVASASAGLVAAAPALVPALFGPSWNPAIGIVPGAAFALVVSGSLSVTIRALLYSRGDGATNVRQMIVMSAAWIAGTLALLPSIGPPAVGWGWLIGATVEAILLERVARRRFGIHVAAAVIVASVLGGAIAAAGYFLCREAPPTLFTAAIAGIAAAVVTPAAIFAVYRPSLRETRTVAGRSFANLRRRA